MVINDKKVASIQLNPIEYAAMVDAMNALKAIKDYFDRDAFEYHTFMNCKTGEIVERSEIARVLGIMDGFLQDCGRTTWELTD